MLSASQNRAVLHIVTHEHRLTEALPSGMLLSSKTEEKDTAGSFMGFSLPQLSTDNYFIGQNYPDGPPNFLVPENGTQEAYLMRITILPHKSCVKISAINKNETASKGLQIQ